MKSFIFKGKERMAVTTLSLFISVSGTSFAAPDAARVAGDLRVDGLVFNLDSSNMQTKASPWGFNGASIYYNVISGKVGIGTVSPTQVLDVNGNANVSGTLSTGSMIVDLPGNNAGSIANTLIFGINSGEGIGSNRTPPTKSAPSENLWGLDFYTNFTKRMSISQSGKVGIGTPTPTQALDVRGNVDVSGSLAVGGNVSINPNSTLSFGSNQRQMINLWANEYGIGIQDFTEYFRTSGDFAWYLGGVHATPAGDPGLGGTTMMKLTSAGLSVAGDLISTGNVVAANMPAIAYANTNPGTFGWVDKGGSSILSELTFTAPATGFVKIDARAVLGTINCSYRLEIFDATNNAVLKDFYNEDAMSGYTINAPTAQRDLSVVIPVSTGVRDIRLMYFNTDSRLPPCTNYFKESGLIAQFFAQGM